MSVRDHGSGDECADSLNQIVPLVYEELRSLARQRLRGERPDHTLNTTALVHEVYLRLSSQFALELGDRANFLAAASNTMRRILVDYARTRTRQKRGGKQQPVPLEDVQELLTLEEAEDMLQFDDAVSRLEKANADAAEVVKLRFFGGLTMKEISTQRGISVRTARRQWAVARAWLRKELIALPQ